MAVWGEASYKVRRAITFRERFSVAELVDATDLTYSQVEQVVQRLIGQGYVRPLEAHELQPAEKSMVERQVGRPRKRYTLTEEPSQRAAFFGRVEAIASAERMSRANSREPSTPFFSRGLQLLEAMERGVDAVSTTHLDEAEELFAAGREFEGLIPEGAEIVRAHYDSALARLEALKGDYSQADALLAQAEEAFQAAGADEQVQEAIDLRLALKASSILVKMRELIDHRADPMPELVRLQDLVSDFDSPSYLLLPLQRAVEAIATVISAAAIEMQVLNQVMAWFGRQATDRVERLEQAMEAAESDIEFAHECMQLTFGYMKAQSVHGGVDSLPTDFDTGLLEPESVPAFLQPPSTR